MKNCPVCSAKLDKHGRCPNRNRSSHQQPAVTQQDGLEFATYDDGTILVRQGGGSGGDVR